MGAPSIDRGRRDPKLDDLIVLARVDFLVFVLMMFPVLHDGQQMVHAPYIDIIVQALESSRKRKRKRLIFNLPPGYMKSLIVSVLYIAWLLGKNPSTRAICISYGDDLTHELSRKTRRVMLSSLYRQIFPNTILDKKAENTISTTRGGQRYATSVGSDIAGFRADIIVLDDPLQPDDAFSEIAKDKLRNWYFGVVSQRLLDQTDGVIILVMHRLAPDDLAGTFIEMGGWFQLALPLIAEKREEFCDHRKRVLMIRKVGEPLNPARASIDICQTQIKSVPSAVADAQYQQRPSFGGAGVCAIGRLVRYKEPPPFELVLHSWDIAATKDGGDWTVCTKYGLTADPEIGDVLYLTGIIRTRIELPDVRELIVAQDAIDKPALIILDGNGVGLGTYQDLLRRGFRNILPNSAA